MKDFKEKFLIVRCFPALGADLFILELGKTKILHENTGHGNTNFCVIFLKFYENILIF